MKTQKNNVQDLNEIIDVSKYLHGSKVERIYRILLSKPSKKRSWYRIAKMADVSYGWAHEILSRLRDQNIIRGSQVKKPYQLFKLWSDRPAPILYREYHIQRPKEVFKNFEFDYAFTTYFAEQLVGNYLFPTLFDIYIHQHDALDWHKFLSDKGYVGKGNVRIFLSDENVFWDGKKIKGWSIVSIQQLIVDLLREGAECTEAAELLIRRYYND
jgi:hypothetical protein